jgi:hypothetical protein
MKQTPKVKNKYTIERRALGVGETLSVVVERGKLTVRSQEKVIPPTLVYEEDGSYELFTLSDVLRTWKPARYSAKSKDFSEERIAQARVANLYKLLESYPTLEQDYSEDKPKPHPLAQAIYGSIFYQRPSDTLQEKLSAMSTIQAGIFQAQCLERATERVFKEQGIRLDQYAVPKKDVGGLAYVADDEGCGLAPKMLAMGFHRAVPLDRLGRELGQLKAAERFINPHPTPFNIRPIMQPYVTGLRVAVCWMHTTMLDSGDLYPSSIPKLAAHIVRRTEVRNWDSIPGKELKLKPKVFHAGVEIVHEQTEKVDELKDGFSCLKLLMPAGVKIAAQLHTDQQAMAGDQPVDLLLDFRTIADKGAVALLAMMHPAAKDLVEPTAEECWALWESLEPTMVEVNGQQYKGYVGIIPVIRTRQRYTELAKGSNKIGCDLVSKAILGEEFRVHSALEDDYQELKTFRQQLEGLLT